MSRRLLASPFRPCEARVGAWLAAGMLALPGPGRADWPMLHGNARHDGFVDARIDPALRLAWAREFTGERLGTALEPIVGAGQVFVATHQGNLYALNAATGAVEWRFAAAGPFLHSPVWTARLVLAGSADGRLYALDPASGQLRWVAEGGLGGFAASPVADTTTVCIGDRSGGFMAVTLAEGRLRWRADLGAPIRQTAAIDGERVFVTAENLQVWCFDLGSGRRWWTSAPLPGQSARDYYPVVVRVGGRSYVIVRTSPAINMAQRIARDRHVLARNAGAEDRDWRTLEAWIKSDAARGAAGLWDREQAAIRTHLADDPTARTFFVLDAETGREPLTAPVLWVGGCQGVGVMPARTADDRLLVFHRTAYGNWNHGVAPLVGLGLLDLPTHRLTPLFHTSGAQPPWNTFWGTADESQNFVVARDTVLVVHQGTLSRYDLASNRLSALWGKRDTYGGLPNPPWARNEWHGPGRGGVAVADDRVFWMTGSRILCLEPGKPGAPVSVQPVEASQTRGPTAPGLPAPEPAGLRERLVRAVEEVLSRRWAPLCVEPGLAGRQFFFDHSGDLFESLAWAYPHLPPPLRARVKAHLAAEWEQHPPFARTAAYPLNAGAPREWHSVPKELRSQPDRATRSLAFGNVHVVALYTQRCDESPRVKEAWPLLTLAHDEFNRSGWRLDPVLGDLHANRYLASLLALGRLAGSLGDAERERLCGVQAGELKAALCAWWQRAGDALREIGTFQGVGELDPFIGRGSAFSFRVAPHCHKLALFHALTPEVARGLDSADPATRRALDTVVGRFLELQPTWWLVGEERQVHFGENLFDPPDHAADAFRALAGLRRLDPGAGRARHVDLPFCRADLFHVLKLALALEPPPPPLSGSPLDPGRE